MSIEQYLKDLIKRVPKELAGAFKGEIVDEIAPFISENFINAQNRSYILQQNGRSSKYVKRTDSNPRLYVNSGRLEKAATVPNAEGNFNKVTTSGDELTIELGVELQQVPYARIHEYGGNAGRGGKTKLPARPYLTPAFEEYQNSAEDGFGYFVQSVMFNLTRMFQ